MRRASFAWIASIVLFTAQASSAPPAPTWPTVDSSVWKRVDIGFVNADYAHRRATDLMAESDRLGGPTDKLVGGSAIASLVGARTVLEGAKARTSKDPRLPYDLSRVQSRLRKCADAAEVLAIAQKLDPKHPFAAASYFELGICHAMEGNHAAEEAAYLRALDLEDDPGSIASVCSNLAESRMAQGKMLLAVEAGEQSIALHPNGILNRWTMAIVRDRAGDPHGAMLEATIATQRDPGYALLDGPGVFFSPEYDRHWYHALGEMALALPTSGAERELHLMTALMKLEAYLEAATPDDRFRAIAKDHVARLEKQLGLKKPAQSKKQ